MSRVHPKQQIPSHSHEQECKHRQNCTLCVPLPLHPCCSSDNSNCLDIFSSCFCETFPDLSLTRPQLMLLLHTLKPQQSATMPNCATEQPRPLHRLRKHNSHSASAFSQKWNTRELFRVILVLRCHITACYPSSLPLFACVGGCWQWNVTLFLLLSRSLYDASFSNLIWISVITSWLIICP